MQFRDISGHTDVKKRLINSVLDGRISHAQLFLGPQGCGSLAMAVAYAQYISCPNKTGEDSCGVCPSCVKYSKLIHPDLHFVYPVVKIRGLDKPVSDDFIKDFREFFLKRNYHRLNDWTDFLDSANAQSQIFAHESSQIIRKIGLKTFESEYKIMIIWYPEKLNDTSANKLLKILEEPPEKTLFILVAENEEEILTTIRSRVQLVKMFRPSNEEIFLDMKKEFSAMDENMLKSASVLSSGNYLEGVVALRQLESGMSTDEFEYFANMMRFCYANQFDKLNSLTEKLCGSSFGREKQKKFFDYCLRMIRECFMLNVCKNYQDQMVNLTLEELAFANKFCAFIHPNNVQELEKEFSHASFSIERNAYGKLAFMNLFINTALLLKVKQS